MTYDTDSPFIRELQSEMEARDKGEQILNVNGSDMGRAIWNLICSKRDLAIYTRKYSDGRPMNMKPHRNWRVTDVKKYFGIKGTGQKLYDNFMELHDAVLGGDEE